MTGRVIVVLVEPQDDINIGNVVRVTRNFGFSCIRLVRPRVANPDNILISAPRSEETIASLERFDNLRDAIAGCRRVYALSARPRTAEWRMLSPTDAAEEVVAFGEDVDVAIVFGREDRGLTNDQLDLCDTIVTIPTDPDYSSMNLGQAVLVQLWEIRRMSVEGVEKPATPPELPSDQMERLYDEVDAGLRAITFYKYGDGEHIMRGLRGVFRKANLDEREYAILIGAFKELQSFLVRAGIQPVDGESQDAGG